MISQIHLRYKRRMDMSICPDCFAPIKWIFDGVYWYPCDREPVLFWPGIGTEAVLHKGNFLTHALMFYPASGKSDAPLTGHKPHYFSCPFCKGARR